MKRYLTFPRTLLRNQTGRLDAPRMLTYIVTFRCNARCIMCDSWKKDGEGDLSLSEIGSIFEQLPQLDVVRLSGGEPFVRKDFGDIVRLAQDKLQPMVLHVTSNGFLTDRIVRFCEQRDTQRPLMMLFSIDGLAAKHDQVRGIERAFERVMNTITALAPRRQALNLRIAVNQTIVDAEGASHYRALREQLAPLGIRNQVVLAYEKSATYSLTRELEVAPKEVGEFCTFGDFGREELARLFDDIERDLSDYPAPERLAKRYYLAGIRNRVLHGRAEPNPKCVELNTHLRLLPDGTVPTCQFNTRPAGNLRSQSFEDFWQSAGAARQRDWVRRCPGCWAECEVLPNAIYTGDIARHALARAPRPGAGEDGTPAREVTTAGTVSARDKLAAQS